MLIQIVGHMSLSQGGEGKRHRRTWGRPLSLYYPTPGEWDNIGSFKKKVYQNMSVHLADKSGLQCLTTRLYNPIKNKIQ